MQTLISYSSSSRAYVDWLAKGRPAARREDVPFCFPDETKKNDRFLMYVGGVDKTFVGWGKVLSDWKIGTGLWKGHRPVEKRSLTMNSRLKFGEPFGVRNFHPRTALSKEF
jgi:hypothetical protein